MDEATFTPRIVVVRPSGELDSTATQRLVADVTSRAGIKTELIVVSLAKTTTVRWNALCILGRAAQTWREAAYDVVVREARPSVRAMLGNVEGIEPAIG